MTDRTSQKTRRVRWLWLLMAACLVFAAVAHWSSGRGTSAGSVDRRVEKLLGLERRQEREDSSPEWVQWAFSTLRRWFKPGDHPDVRGELVALGPKAIRPLSKALLNDRSPAVRSMAAGVLGELAEPQTMPALTNALSAEGDEGVVARISEALSLIGDARAVPVILSALDRQTNGHMSAQMVLGCLGRFRGPLVVETLTHVLAHQTNEALRATAAEGLGETGEASACTNLMAALKGDQAPSVRCAAALALGRLKPPGAVAALTRLMREDAISDVRQAAAAALTNSESVDAIAELTSALAEENDDAVRERMVETLCSMDQPEATRALIITATNDPSPSVRELSIAKLASTLPRRRISDLLGIMQGKLPDKLREAAPWHS